MCKLSRVLCIVIVVFTSCYSSKNSTVKDYSLVRSYETSNKDFNWLLAELGTKIKYQLNCLTIISDKFYDDSFSKEFFRVFQGVPIFKVLVQEHEDLLSPNYKTLSTVQQARKNGCNCYILLISNGLQLARFLRFGDRHRIIDTRAKYIVLYDKNLFLMESRYLWKKIVNVIFIRKYRGSSRYEFSTVPFPAEMDEKYLTNRVDTWRAGKFQFNSDLFVDKTSNLKQEIIHVATFPHMPSTVKTSKYNEYTEETAVKYGGLEVEILDSLSNAMNFDAVIYEPKYSEVEGWGRKQLNGSLSGLFGEVTTGKADMVLGNLVYTPYHLKMMDLSRPYTTQCYTFVTPESTTDNSRKTLILPFRFYMWIAIIITLFLCSVIFYGLAKFQNYIITSNPNYQKPNHVTNQDLFKLWNEKKSVAISYGYSRIEGSPEGLYLFDKLDYSLFSVYSMLLLVSLPKLPTGWSLRMMTGWWWIFCLLVTVAYRASMTAILANPAQKITIDTLEELASSDIGCGGWGEQNKEFFTTSLDSAGQKVGYKYEIMYDPDKAIQRVADGKFAYYENIFFLHHAKVKQKLMESSNLTDDKEDGKNLHIMDNCIINMPISLGLSKNSPLKPRVDIFLQRVIEAGLVKKWLRDTMLKTMVAEAPLSKIGNIAFMDLNKFFGAIVLLFGGYALSSIVFLIENIYWYRFVVKTPLFDKYNKSTV